MFPSYVTTNTLTGIAMVRIRYARMASYERAGIIFACSAATINPVCALPVAFIAFISVTNSAVCNWPYPAQGFPAWTKKVAQLTGGAGHTPHGCAGFPAWTKKAAQLAGVAGHTPRSGARFPAWTKKTAQLARGGGFALGPSTRAVFEFLTSRPL